MKLYSTLSGEATDFTPADGHTVRMYVCGVTPYSSTHIGHALSYVAFDVLRRYLEHLGFQVRHVQNFTDVDDKIIQRAQEQGIQPGDLAERYIQDFFQTMDALNIRRAHVYPRATEEIGPIIETIARLVQSGHAYPAGGDVFFRVEKSEGYGKLSHRTLAGMQAGSRIEIDENKEHPMDFALWKGARPDEPPAVVWQSPWGPGRPGWHIECTSMSMTYLGETLDIHGGGQDLVFPHHENEIAQSEASTGVVPFSRYWVHNGLLRLGGDKMSKSLGNLISVEEALERYSPDTIRLYFLSSHYRSPLSYTDHGCAAMERSLDRLRQALTRPTTPTPTPATQASGKPADGGDPTPAPAAQASGKPGDDADPTPTPAAQAGSKPADGADPAPTPAAAPNPTENPNPNSGNPKALDAQPYRQQFFEAMDDDLNTPRALAALFDLAREINRASDAARPVAAAQDTLRHLGNILGLTFAPPATTGSPAGAAAGPFIELLLETRAALRQARQFDQADRIRNGLEQLGVAVEDTPNGPTWQFRHP